MGKLEEYKPAIAMLGLQVCYAGLAIFSRAIFLQGMSPRVFILYRQLIATVVTAPLAYFSRRKSGKESCSLDLRGFSMIFLISLIGITMNQNLYFEGLFLASSTMGSAMSNLVPGITFIMASIVGLEKLNVRSIRSLAKILGTAFCVAGAISMSLLRGPKLLNAESLLTNIQTHKNWLLGCLFLLGSTCCWSLWLILQVSVTSKHPDHISLSAWMCFFSTLQCAAVALVLDTNPTNWIIHSYIEFAACFFAGTVASALAFVVQSWCVSKRGPLYSAMFNPLCTIIVTILAAIFLHEEIYAGSLVGGVIVIIGLYIVLWGKARDIEKIEEETDPKSGEVKIWVDGDSDEISCKMDLQEPLLSQDKSNVRRLAPHQCA